MLKDTSFDLRKTLDRLGVPVEKIEASATLIGRRLEPHEIAPLAVYLASAEANVMTGQSINIDGGRLMS